MTIVNRMVVDYGGEGNERVYAYISPFSRLLFQSVCLGVCFVILFQQMSINRLQADMTHTNLRRFGTAYTISKAVTVVCLVIANLNMKLIVPELLVNISLVIAYLLLLTSMTICFVIFQWIPIELHYKTVVNRDGVAYIVALQLNEQEYYRIHLDTMEGT